MPLVHEGLAREGVLHLPGVLDAAALGAMERAFQHSVDHPSPAAVRFYPNEDATFFEDTGSNHLGVAREVGIVDTVKRLWGVDDVWYFGEQLFLKEGGSARRTPWHQDTSYLRIRGQHMVAVWVTLDPLRREHALEFVRGSHLGQLYNGSAFAPDDDTKPLYKQSRLPRLPDIQADRSMFDIVSWPIEPGDLLVFHLGILHGGAGTSPGVRRRTLSLRFLGPDVVFDGQPRDEVGAQEGNDAALAPMYGQLRDGDPFAPMLGAPV